MADTFVSPVAPVAPPPSASDLLASFKPDTPAEVEVSQKQRLLLGAKVLKPTPPPQLPEKLPPTPNINLAARKAQYTETDPSPDPEAVWRKLEAKPDVVRGRSGDLFRKLLAGSALPETDWEELKSNLSSLAEATTDVDEDLTVGKGKVSSLYAQPDGVWMTLDYEPEATDDLPASLTGKPSKALPAAALEWPASDFTAFAGPTDVVYAGRVSDKLDRQLRTLRPGPVGKDGVPRWVPVEPLPVTSHNALEASTLSEPGTVIESYVGKDVYPGTRGGDWVVWDVPEQVGPQAWKPPAWMQGRAERLQLGVGSSQPKYRLQPVAKDDITDQHTLDRHLDETSWAVFEAQGDPQSTSRLVGRLKKQGVEPIELINSGRRAWLAFGVDPQQAANLSQKRPVYTNDGVVTDSEEPEAQRWQFRTASGTVSFNSTPGLTSGAMPRTQKRASRFAFQVDPTDSARLGRFAADLEALGVQNLSVYSREEAIDGFEPAREYLYSDGVSLKVARTASSRVGDSNAIPLHVRSTAGWPKDRPVVDANAVDTRGIPAEESGGRFTLEGGEDLGLSTQLAAVLAAKHGADKVKVNTPTGRLKFTES